MRFLLCYFCSIIFLHHIKICAGFRTMEQAREMKTCGIYGDLLDYLQISRNGARSKVD